MTAVFIKPQGGDHWYTSDGTPRYDATLREARKENLFPSPTTVLGIVHSQGLERWKIQQTVDAGIATERGAAEDEDAYKVRVLERSDTLRRSAAELGTKVHHGIERLISWRLWDESSPILNAFHDWAVDNIRGHDWAERVLVNHKLGVAGKADALIYFQGKAAELVGGEPVLVDWKTQGMKLSKAKKPSYKPNYYNKWTMQLAFYASCEMTPPRIVSVVINTTEPGEPFLKLWTEEEQASAFEAFKSALALWQYDKNYHPELT